MANTMAFFLWISACLVCVVALTEDKWHCETTAGYAIVGRATEKGGVVRFTNLVPFSVLQGHEFPADKCRKRP